MTWCRYFTLRTSEELVLHVTALANFAMAAIATLRDAGMDPGGEEPWGVGADFYARLKVAGADAPCLHIKVHRAATAPAADVGEGAATGATAARADIVQLAVDAGRGAGTTIGAVKQMIEGVAGVPADQQLVFYGGLPLDDDAQSLEHYAIKLDTGESWLPAAGIEWPTACRPLNRHSAQLIQ
jgi:hypothetical protein